MARAARVSLREFLLVNLGKHKNLTAMARSLGVTPQRVRIDLSRTNIVEIRRYYETGQAGTVKAAISYIPEEAVSPPFLPVIPPQ